MPKRAIHKKSLGWRIFPGCRDQPLLWHQHGRGMRPRPCAWQVFRGLVPGLTFAGGVLGHQPEGDGVDAVALVRGSAVALALKNVAQM